ncbi:hypothetical protein BD410DRAFT_789214 [Rickenella mellea]|uniref:Uncharacterized protein n=1 Tax=Rickenella mellea TaxID=50990 RepID=A0A4Y7Q4T1_9AGAM|nr:hypothetical protein BD410DRAFT_789214 [Rickenella mellea]
MCCNSNNCAAPPNDTNSLKVSTELVAAPLPDGYWIHALPFHTGSEFADLIAFGLGFNEKPAAIKLLSNPRNTGSSGWKVTEIASLEFPVASIYADLTGTGTNDIIICDRYGPGMSDLWDAKKKNGGRLQWLRNPGSRDSQPFWEAKTIGNSTGMHRLLAGHFTTPDVIQIMGFPILSSSSDLVSPAPILIYTPVYGPNGPEYWKEDTPFPSQFRIIHDAKLVPGGKNALDMVLVAGKEGVAFLWFDFRTARWFSNIIGEGLQGTKFTGAGSADLCCVRDDKAGYITSSEGLHGNSVAVYIKLTGAPKGAASLMNRKYWRRVVVDNYGSLDPVQGTGTIHQVAAVPLPNSDIDSFTIACMGAPVGQPANQGVYLYTPTDLSNGVFTKTKITGESASIVTVLQRTDTTTDIASISYYVPGYHTGPDPPSVRINSLSRNDPLSITASLANNEISLYIPHPGIVPTGRTFSVPFWALAGRKLQIVILAPNDSIQLEVEIIAIKVIYGSVAVAGEDAERLIAPPPKKSQSTRVPPKSNVRAGLRGAVFITFQHASNQYEGPFSTMSQVASANILPSIPSIPADVLNTEFPFNRVENLPWATSGLWNGFEFFNATGFHIRFNDSPMGEIVHVQAWTLGIGETARFHNHSDVAFCEIHYCLSNGNGDGGMRYFEDDNSNPVDTNKELTKSYVDENSKLLVVPDLQEHGALWKVVPGTVSTPQIRPNGTVDYPWHAWLASKFGEYDLPITPPLEPKEQRFDVWLAFEFPPSAFQF